MSTGQGYPEEAPRQSEVEPPYRPGRRTLGRNPYGLTLRELVVLDLIVAGKTDKEIAAELAISPHTVHKHVSNILGKMDARSRTEAGLRALREGLVD